MSTEHRLAIKSAAWLTYAWEDNRSGDVDFVAQELVEAGVEIKLDRWNLKAGVRLWNQIAEFIQDPAHSNAWILYATQNSLGSEPCREEFAYALERALKGRGESFPVIGLFPGRVDKQLIPPGISTRLYVSLTDPDWKTRVAAALEGKDPSIQRPNVQPYEVRVHRDVRGAPGGGPIVIELRPRAGTWVPFFLNIASVEADAV